MSLSETTATWSKRTEKESTTTIVKISLKLPLKREVEVDGEGNKELFKGCDKLFKGGSLLRGKRGEASPYQYYLSTYLSLYLYLSPASASASCFISAPTSISADCIKSDAKKKIKVKVEIGVLNLSSILVHLDISRKIYLQRSSITSYISSLW